MITTSLDQNLNIVKGINNCYTPIFYGDKYLPMPMPMPMPIVVPPDPIPEIKVVADVKQQAPAPPLMVADTNNNTIILNSLLIGIGIFVFFKILT